MLTVSAPVGSSTAKHPRSKKSSKAMSKASMKTRRDADIEARWIGLGDGNGTGTADGMEGNSRGKVFVVRKCEGNESRVLIKDPR